MSVLLKSNFVGMGKRIEDVDIPRIASKIDCGEDELHAFMDVEASGSGFDRLGRPKALFEPHKFYSHLREPLRSRAVASGLAYAKWGTSPYPKDSYARIKSAMLLDETAALMSTSWGLGQVMGENFKICGYDSVQAMVLDFMDDEEKHLEAIVSFLIANNIADDLAAHRWAVVARVYNGPGYAKNHYDVKMERAYAKWAAIPDTPWEGAVALKDTKNEITYPVIRRGSKNDAVEALQRVLYGLGYTVTIDGDFGPKTEGKVKLYQARNGLVADGVVGTKTWSKLLHI